LIRPLPAATMLLAALTTPALAVPPAVAPVPTGVVARESGNGQKLLLTVAPTPQPLHAAAPHPQPLQVAAAPQPLPAAVPPREPRTRLAAGDALLLRRGTGRILHLNGPAANVFVADPKVAEVHPAGPTTLFVFGVGAGRTTIAALDANGRLLGAYDVTVQPSVFSATSAQAEIARMVPAAHVQVQAQPKGLLLTGWVGSPAEAARVVAIAQGFLEGGQTLQNQIVVRASVQVTLAVRIVQMTRSLSDNLGINWQALGTIGSIGTLGLGFTGAGGVASLVTNGFVPASAFSNASQYTLKSLNINAALNALAQDGLVRMLAEPNLTVISGQTASFLVGGQIPVPVPGQNGQVTIEYKNFGVSLKFLPTVFSDGRINIHVAPEVSQPSTASTVSVAAANQVLVVPSFNVSQAETTVQLGSGQSFAIGGLLQDTINDSGSGIPNLGNVPILGALFHNDNFTRQQTELVIIVTPYIVHPVDSVRQLQTPDENYTAPSDLQRLLFMRQIGTPKHWQQVHVPGAAGFMVQ
jgi:pilus assembly protein CpaC